MTSDRPRCHSAPDAPWTLLFALLTVNLVFLLMHALSFLMWARVPRLMYLDQEGNIPTWWSATQLLLAGLQLGLVAFRSCHVRPSAAPLGLLAALLILMSIDEVASLHEKIGLEIDTLLGGRPTLSFHFTGVWFLVIGLPFAILVAIILRQLSVFLTEVPGTTRWLSFGFAVLLSGAVGVEAVSNLVVPAGMEDDRFEMGGYIASVAIEEFLEMTGGSILLWTSVGLVRAHWSTRDIATLIQPATAGEAARLRGR